VKVPVLGLHVMPASLTAHVTTTAWPGAAAILVQFASVVSMVVSPVAAMMSSDAVYVTVHMAGSSDHVPTSSDTVAAASALQVSLMLAASAMTSSEVTTKHAP
jgi:hypothetical protein